MAQVHVELVAPERELWSGEADLVVARTTEGELGILPGHISLLGELADGGVVRIRNGGEEVVAAVHGGFLSVNEDRVRILAELAELGSDIDTARAQAALDRARGAGAEDEAAQAAALRAQARLRAAGHTG